MRKSIAYLENETVYFGVLKNYIRNAIDEFKHNDISGNLTAYLYYRCYVD